MASPMPTFGFASRYNHGQCPIAAVRDAWKMTMFDWRQIWSRLPLTAGAKFALIWLLFGALGNIGSAIAIAISIEYSTFTVTYQVSRVAFGGGQAAWIVMWSVLAPWGLRKRVAFCVGATLLLYVSFLITPIIDQATNPYVWQRLWAILTSVPSMGLAVLLPLWVLRSWCGWRLTAPYEDASTSTATALRIRDLLITTTVVAAALAMARLAVPGDATNASRFVVSAVSTCLVLAGTSLVTTVPAAAAAYRPRQVDSAVILLVVSQAAAFTFGIALLFLLSRNVSAEATFHFTVAAAVFFVTLDIPLLVTRGLGYRLLWRTRGKHVTRPTQG